MRISRRNLLPIVSVCLFAGCAPVQFSKISSPVTASNAPASAPAPLGPGEVYGQVTDALSGTPIVGANVSLASADGQGSFASTVSDQNGNYQILNVSPGAYLANFSANNYLPVSGVQLTMLAAASQNLNESLTPPLQANQARIVLTWTGPAAGAIRDVDSYLAFPGFDAQTNLDQDLIYFANKVVAGGNLDHDNTQWSGPETVTINNLSSTGTYDYYVNNYNCRQNLTGLGASHVHVDVYMGTATSIYRQYDIPPGNGYSYDVFHIVNGEFIDINQYNDSLWVAPNDQCIE